jgi:nucleotidyltransferase AbiEii toxin of type IV toxin-antitoxin system
LSDKPTLQQLLEIQQHFSLPSTALVEKDWYVVKALAAIMAADTKPFRLIFGGGTALARAYGLIQRMSEDIDLRIVGPEKPTRGQLRILRKTITDALLKAGFKFDPDKHRETMYEGRYTIYRIPYEPTAEGQGALRPEIQIETAVFPLRRDAVERPVTSFVAEGFSRPPEIPAIACASILETAADKLVALTRRAGAELAGLREKRDPTLVRHIHDLHAIRDQYDPADVAKLARQIMVAEAKTRAQDYPAYQADPLAETLKAIEGIAAGADYAADYAAFQRDMVYGGGVDFETAVATLKQLGEHMRQAQG